MQIPPAGTTVPPLAQTAAHAFLGITLEGWLTLIAVLVGPILAVQAQKWLERRRQDHTRKVFLFRELMATRATRLSTRHVEALNLIDLEFTAVGGKDKAVREAWRSYLDALGIPHDPQNQQLVFDRRDRAFTELLYQMAKRLGFAFDSVAIERNVYSPIGHGKLEDDQDLIRRGLVDLLSGKRALSTVSWLMPGQAPLRVIEVPNVAVVPTEPIAEQPQPRQALEPARPPEGEPGGATKTKAETGKGTL